jgi:dihydrolipoamide dehydrogenase
MEKLTVDVAVMGAGTAGLVAYRAAVAQGARTVLIEGGPYGTTCARVGCMPSKLLIAAAEAAHMLDLAPRFGVHPGERRIDGVAVMERVRRERDRFVGFVLDGVDAIPAADKLRGYARFTGPNTLRVGEDIEVEAKRIVIATGSTPTRLPKLDNVGPGVITSDDVFEWQDLPRSVAPGRARQRVRAGRQRGADQRSHRAAPRGARAGRGNRPALPVRHPARQAGRRRGRAVHA